MIMARREEKRRQGETVRRLVFAITTEASILVVAALAMGVHLAQINGIIGDLNDQIKKLQPRVTEISQLQIETNKLSPKVDTLDGAKSDTLFWYGNLRSVIDCLPPKTWLTSLATGGSSDGTKPGQVSGTDPVFSASGISLDPATVGETIERMNARPSLDHVDLAGVTSQKIGLLDTVNFQVTIHLKPQPTALPATKGSSNGQKS